MHRRVVEQKPTNVDTLGVAILRSARLPVKGALDDAKYLASHSAQWVSDCIIIWVVSQAKRPSSAFANAISPIGVDGSGIPSGQPGFWVDTAFLQFLLAPLAHLLVVRLDQSPLACQSS